MSLSIRKPEWAEANALASAAYAAWRKGIGPYVSEAARMRISELDFADFIRGNPEQVLAAFIGDVAAGFAATEHGDNYISDLWVDPDFEGRGIGSSLLAAWEESIRSRDYDTVTIEVITENARALGLYRHLGFVVSWQGETTDGYLKEPLHKTRLMKALS